MPAPEVTTGANTATEAASRMDRHTTPFWYPDRGTMERAQASRLAGALGLADYDALCAFAADHPDRYWRALMEALPIVWSKPYRDYVDLTDGPQFPKWFVGGELNWTDTVFAPGHPDDRPAVIAETEAGHVETVSYGELRRRVSCLAAGLKALGIGRGDRVGLLMEMGVEATVAVLAVSWLGAIAAPLFSGFGPDAIVSRLRSAGACALIVTSGFYRRGRWVDIAAVVQAARPQLPSLRHVIVKAADGARSIPDALAFDDVAGGKDGGAAERMDPNDPMMVIYTSGTTGRPKGAVHTHGGFPLKIAHDAAVHFDIGAGDVFFWPADLGWVAGSLTIASALMRGATLVCYDGAPDMPDWSRLSRIAQAHLVTHLGASPTLIRGLAAHKSLATAGDCGSVRLLITAGEVIDPEHMVWFASSFGRGTCPVINYTGGTEVSGALLANVVVRPIVAAGFNSVSPGVAADVLDDDGHPVRDRIGELSILQPFVGMTQSFWNDRERYLESYWQKTPGIWTHGDLALRTSDDVLFLLGRSDDTLKIAGKRVGPAEIEDVLNELPEIAETAAIGVEDPVTGQKLIVFVVASGAAQVPDAHLAATVMTTIATRLGKPFQPSRVHVVTQLPRTRSSKIMRRIIRRIYSGQDPGDLSSLEDASAVEVIRAAARDGAIRGTAKG
ncbi:MAG: AMP-binding protein [Acetobacteraceae bacterium]